MQQKYCYNRDPISAPKHMIPTSEDLPYIALTGAILESVVKDYEHAVFFEDIRQQGILSRWLHSEWGQTLSMNNGDFIERRVKEEMKELNKYVEWTVGGRIVSTFEATAERKELLKNKKIQHSTARTGHLAFRNLSLFKAAVEAIKGKEE